MEEFIKLDHVGIAVKDLQEVLKTYELLGFKCLHTEAVASQKVNTAALPVGETNLELLEPASEDSPIAKFLASRGEGVHHLAFQVKDIEAKLSELQEAGFRLIDAVPRLGAGGAKVAFLHPRDTKGTLIELVQRSSG